MRWLVCVVVCFLIAVTRVDAARPRDHVLEVAELIEAHYYDVDRGRVIARELASDAEQGAFDGIDDANELAVRLTDRLRRIDRHFKVMWGERRQPLRRGAPRATKQGSDVEYGFGRVERLAGDVGYIQLLEATHIDFADPDSPVRAKVDAVLAEVRDAGALILDLRTNGGGSPAMVGYLVSAFVSPTADVYNTFHTREEVLSERPDVHYADPMLNTPLFVLVGPGTASAAESLAYTLQACGRAIIVGEPSAGAANPGAVFAAASGYSVFVPTGSPRNPITKRNWEGDGVQPNVSVAASDALRKAHVRARGEE